MNPNNNKMASLENNLASSQGPTEEDHKFVCVEPCEFEALLQRAMEILDAQARTATASRT